VVHITTTDVSLAWLLGPQLEAFAAAGYEVIGVSAPGRHVAALADAGIEHVAWPSATRSMDPKRDVRATRELAGILRRLRPDIAHTHNPKPGWFGRPVARLTRVPVVVNTVHGLYALPDDPAPKRVVVYGLERMGAAFSHGELVQNPEDLELLGRLGVPRRRLRLLGNGVDLRRFDPDRLAEARAEVRAEIGAGADEVVVGVVGRLVAEKGLAEVLAAAHALADHQPPLRWVLIGPDDHEKSDAFDRERLTAAARDGVVAVGERSDIERFYAGMDLFVLASHREGFPRAAMEAAAMGLPIVATDIRGCRQVVADGITGRLVPVADPAALAAAVAELAADPNARLGMGEAARLKAAAEFDQERVIATTLALYEELLERA
jgi:glycosyltransferase involved in cell wall biosynthesis